MENQAAVVLRVLRAEGWRAALGRAADRVEERLKVARPAGALRRDAIVLNVLGVPAARRLGGLPTQLLGRLAAESHARVVALLHPARGGFRLLTCASGEWRATTIAGVPSFAEALAAATAALGTRTVHLESLSGLAPHDVLAPLALGLDLVLSIHEFAGWCPTAHLLEAPSERFCGFSADPARCARCLRSTPHADDLTSRRAAMTELLGAARATVFPSRYLRDQHHRLFPGARAGIERIIEPGSRPRSATDCAATTRNGTGAVAFVGSVSPLKGGRLIEPVVRDLHERDPTIPIHVLGGGDAALLLGLRTLSNVTVHGYYRAGSLPAHLARLGVEVAVAPSIVPEAFQLTISECWLAGVPVVAFDHGAAAERIPAHGGGIAVPLGAGAAGLALAIEELRSGAVPCDLADAAASVPSSAAAAAALRQLYAELGLASAGST